MCADGLLQQISSTCAATTLVDAANHRLVPSAAVKEAMGSSLTMVFAAPADHLGAAAVVGGVHWCLAALHVARGDQRGDQRLVLGGPSARAARGTAGDRYGASRER